MNEFRERFGAGYRRAHVDECPPSEALSELAAGRAWPWRRRRLAAHLSECGACADDYRAIRSARPELMAALEAHAAEDRPVFGRAGVVAAAAMLALAVAVSAIVGTGDTERAGSDVVLFASEFEPDAPASRSAGSGDRLFRSDFGDVAVQRSRVLRDG